MRSEAVFVVLNILTLTVATPFTNKLVKIVKRSTPNVEECRYNCIINMPQPQQGCWTNDDCFKCWNRCDQVQVSNWRLRVTDQYDNHGVVTSRVEWERREDVKDFIVTWEVVGGGLKGHLITSETSADLTLLSDTAYNVQVESLSGVLKSQLLRLDTSVARPDVDSAEGETIGLEIVAGICAGVCLLLAVLLVFVCAKFLRSGAEGPSPLDEEALLEEEAGGERPRTRISIIFSKDYIKKMYGGGVADWVERPQSFDVRQDMAFVPATSDAFEKMGPSKSHFPGTYPQFVAPTSK